MFFKVEGKIVKKNTVEFTGSVPVAIGDAGDNFTSPFLSPFNIGTSVVITFRTTDKQKRVISVSPVKVQPEPVAPVDTGTAANSVESSIMFYIDPKVQKILDAVQFLAAKARFASVMFEGASGYGKTSSPIAWAEQKGLKVLRVDCAKIESTEEWFGTRELVQGATGSVTQFVKSLLWEALEEGNYLIILDEINRCSPAITNSLFQLLDSGTTTVHGEVLQIGTNIVIVATRNIGHIYSGTFPMDEALANRFPASIRVGALPFDAEVKIVENRCGITTALATDIVTLANRLRKNEVEFDVSTRTTIAIGNLVSAGLTLNEAVEYAVINRIDAIQAKDVVDALNTL